MKTIKLMEGDVMRFESALHASEEIIALLLPVLTAVENEAEPDTHLIATYLDHAQGDREKDLRAFRWMVAVLYIRETTAKNGMPYYRNHGVMLPLLPDCERIAMANHIEGAMTERHGSDNAEHIVSLYASMIDGGGTLRLSEWGTDIMDAMHEALTLDVASGVLEHMELRTH